MLELEITLVCLFTFLCPQSPHLRLCMSSPVLPLPLSLSVLCLPPLISPHFFVYLRSWSLGVAARLFIFCSLALVAWCSPDQGHCCVACSLSEALRSLPSVKRVVSMLAVVRLIGYGVQDHYHFQQMDFLFPILVVIPIPSLCDCVWYYIHNQVLNGFIMAYAAVDLRL